MREENYNYLNYPDKFKKINIDGYTKKVINDYFNGILTLEDIKELQKKLPYDSDIY